MVRLFDRVRAAVLAFKNKTAYEQWLEGFMTGEDVGPGPFIKSDEQTAMKYSAVFACNRVLSETYASSPVMLYRKKSEEEREKATDLAVYDILHNRPNEEMSAYSYKEATLTSLNLGGNTVSERLVNRRGDLIGLYPYPWQTVTIRRNKDTRRLEYVIGDENKDGKVLSRDEVFHIPGLSYDGVIGLSPISYAAEAIKLGLTYEQFGVQLYKNGANASGAFEHPGSLKEDAFKRLKKEVAENWTGLTNTGRPMLLEDGMKFSPFTIKPADAQLIESKRFQIEDICRIYRVPPHLVQDLSRSTNNNIEQQSLEFVMYTMLPHYKRSEEAISSQLLTREQREAGYYVEFKIEGLLRGDIQSRYRAYAIGRQWGILSINDIRRLENMNPIPGGDVYLQPLNMIDVTQASEYYSNNGNNGNGNNGNNGKITDEQIREIEVMLERG